MDILLKQDFAFTEADVRKNVLLPFQTTKRYDRLVIALYYGPKAIREPEIIRPQIEACVRRYFPAGQSLSEADMAEFRELYNFVTLSIDFGDTYVGCAHRHSPEQQIVISDKGSSWGFLPLAAEPGDWRVVLHVQAVVAGQVDYHITVCGMEGGESDDLLQTL